MISESSDESVTSESLEESSDQDEEQVGARRFAVDIVALTREWGGDSELSEELQGRQTRYRNMALAIEAAEMRLSTRPTRSRLLPETVCFESARVQAGASFLIFITTNARTFVNALVVDHYFLNLQGVEAWGKEAWQWDSFKKDSLYFVFFAMDICFMLFQIACVRRDRCMAQLYQRLCQESAILRLIALHIYTILFLGVFSGWQLVRAYRQLAHPGYRDSFLLELGDPSMADSGAFRMPFYSSHLTFCYEVPFMLRILHFLSRDFLSLMNIVVSIAAFGSFSLVVFALMTFDYGVSSNLVSRYSTSKGCCFGVVHALLRGTEVFTRALAVTSTVLAAPIKEFGDWLFLAVVLDWLMGLLLLSWASKGFSKRTLFLSVPLFGANIALFTDLPGLCMRARVLTMCLDVLRALELVPAVWFYLLEYNAIVSGQISGNLGFPGRVLACLVVMLCCWCGHFSLRCWFWAVGLRGVGRDPCQATWEKTGSLDDAVFGSSLDEAYFYQTENPDLTHWLFAKGVGDQFASLLEICWERQPLRLSRLEALDKLGEGGFGRVYKVRDTRRGKEYALKLQVRNRVARAAVQEANVLHQVKHFCVVELIQVFCTSSFYCILLELCEVDLNRYILDCQNPGGVAAGLPVQDIKVFLGCIFLALQHLHDREIVFCDLKPENTLTQQMVYKKQAVKVAKLADFGLAKSIEKLSAQSSQSLCGRVSGTPAFLPPDAPFQFDSLAIETREEMLPQFVSRDWYALGCVLFLMIYGEVGGRKIRHGARAVLLPPACEVLAGFLSSAASGRDADALHLVDRLTAPLAQRGSGRDLRDSRFLADTLPQLEQMASDFGFSTP